MSKALATRRQQARPFHHELHLYFVHHLAFRVTMAVCKRRLFLFLAILASVILLTQLWVPIRYDYNEHVPPPADESFIWRRLKPNYPVASFHPLPKPSLRKLPSVQAKFATESAKAKDTTVARQNEIKASFERSWQAYKDHAWLKDEVTPISGKSKDTFGGWGATLIDSLDTLWIMGLKTEFNEAVEAVSKHISFETTEASQINVFETTIRFLGGLLSAYDLSQDIRLLEKARDAGDMLYKAFDTPNHMPVTRWDIHKAARGEAQVAQSNTLLAEIGSLAMEFTRLSFITKDAKYYDAVQRITELLDASQMKTKLPGLWPIVVNAEEENFDAGNGYSLGAMADSTYEYLSKMVALLGDADSLYGRMYEQSMAASHQHLLYRPMTPEKDDILFPGVVHVNEGKSSHETSGGHLQCFTGGMFALGGKLLSNNTHVDIGSKLARGCVWAYEALSTGVMPETFHLTACPDLSECDWDESAWHAAVLKAASPDDGTSAEEIITSQRLPKGFTKIPDTRYILRPEAIESVFLLFRITGDSYWREKAWKMWTAIDKLTRTDLANSAVWSVNPEDGKSPDKADSMESFWLGETLKYFYLVFSEPDVISLDEWVFNTEAHPFRRLKAGR